MTVSTTTNKVSYIGNGVATTFAIPFPFLEEEHLKVWQLLNDIQTERTDWTVSGGNMVFATAPAENTQIVIMREVPLTQETDYRENEILPAETLERNFDKLTMQVQRLAEENDRAVKVDMFSNTAPNEYALKIEAIYDIRNDIVTDAQVQALGGTHSAKEWANVTSGANKDLSNLTTLGNDKFVTKNTTQTISGDKTILHPFSKVKKNESLGRGDYFSEELN